MSNGTTKFVCIECGKIAERMEMHYPGREWKLLGIDIGKCEPIVMCMDCYDSVGLSIVRPINGKPIPKLKKFDRPLTELEAMATE